MLHPALFLLHEPCRKRNSVEAILPTNDRVAQPLRCPDRINWFRHCCFNTLADVLWQAWCILSISLANQEVPVTSVNGEMKRWSAIACSSRRARTFDLWTPKLRCIPEHSMHSVMPRLVLVQRGSGAPQSQHTELPGTASNCSMRLLHIQGLSPSRSQCWSLWRSSPSLVTVMVKDPHFSLSRSQTITCHYGGHSPSLVTVTVTVTVHHFSLSRSQPITGQYQGHIPSFVTMKVTVYHLSLSDHTQSIICHYHCHSSSLVTMKVIGHHLSLPRLQSITCDYQGHSPSLVTVKATVHHLSLSRSLSITCHYHHDCFKSQTLKIHL